MKFAKLMLIPITIAAINVAQAKDLPPKQVNLPFVNQKINSSEYAGLLFNYAMGTDKKVVCKLTNIYKSWLEYNDQNAVKQTGTFGSQQAVIFTTKGQDHDRGETISVYHADPSGVIKVNEVHSKDAIASCFYMKNSTK